MAGSMIGTRLTAVAILALMMATIARAQVISDDFSDLNDTANPTWTRLDGLVLSNDQTWDASTGVYRMSAPSNGFDNLGSVGSHVGPSYTDVRVTMDLVEFYTSFAPPNGPEFIHIMARSNGNNEFGGLTGYAYGYDPLADANAGELVLFRVDPGPDLNDIGAQRVTLDEMKDYRFMLEVIGNTIHGQVTEIATGNVVAESFKTTISGSDPVYASGTSGVFAYTQSPFNTLFAIDNFRTEPALAGDYNRDGSVDAADYVVWRHTLGQMSPQLDPVTSRVISLGDMRANGAVTGTCGYNTPNCEVIDQADYEVWRANFGRTISGGGGGSSIGGVGVPEPGSAVLCVVGAAIFWFGRRGARQ